MKKNIQYISIILFALLFVISGCQKDSYELGDLVAPSNVTLNYEIVGVDAENPNGDGSGLVNFIATADNKITFNFEFGDGKKLNQLLMVLLPINFQIMDLTHTMLVFLLLEPGHNLC